MPPRSAPRRLMSGLKFSFLAASALLGALLASAAPVKFDIPAQSAAEALQAFSRQANVEVLFPFDELRKVAAREVKGEREPDKAIAELLAGTGYEAKQTSPKNFVVAKAAASPGSVKGTLSGTDGLPLAGVLVMIRELGLSTSTDRYGQYAFPKVAAGTYVLVATSRGYQPLHITDVTVRAGRDVTLGQQEMRSATDDLTRLEAYVVRADDVARLDPFEVSGRRGQPFTDANLDIPRTINDAQPYYIYDSATLTSSGAVNVEEFLKERLTMNTVALTNAQTSAANAASVSLGNTSTINLRGIGADKTLILVNGRRAPSTMFFLSEFQPDVNGIPISAIDRIEVLPTSASGIYGSSALGGVVNIVLKRNFTGGEIRAIYDNTFDTDAPRRTLSATYGASLGKKTQLMITGQWSDTAAMLTQDRLDLLETNVARIRVNNPAFLSSTTTPGLGSLTNVAASTGNLVLDNNVNLGTSFTHVPAGTSATTPFATLAAGLQANAGKYDLRNPPSRQSPYGLLRPIGSELEVKSFQASLRHQLFPRLELFTEFRYGGNYSVSNYDPTGAGSLTVPATSPINPFIGAVRVRVPVSVTDSTVVTNSINRSLSVGFNAKLPYNWVALGDYTWSDQNTQTYSPVFDSAAVTAAFNSGALNPFVDTLQFGFDLDRYVVRTFGFSDTRVEALSLRGSGPLPSLPWGAPQLTVGGEHRRLVMPENRAADETQVFTYFPRWQVSDAAYGELSVPLIKEKRFPLLYALEVQVAGRHEKFTVKTGTPSTILTRSTGVTRYGTPNIGGQPFFDQDDYTATNYTVGLKYQPVRDLIIRASRATAFLPPTPAQLLENPTQVQQSITFDPKDPTVTGTKIIPAVSGGNPDLKPQNSESLNAGIIWQPGTGWFKNLRLNVEYYKLTQHDFITVLSAQNIVNNEDQFPGRVTRDAAGHIIFLNVRQVNLFMRENSGVDFTANYFVKTGWGRFTFHGQHSTILTLKTQYLLNTPAYDAAGYPNDSNGAIKHKTNGTFGWERGNWLVNWTTRHTPSYYTAGSPGSPFVIQNPPTTPTLGTYLAQGSASIPAQTYHDATVEYSFRRSGNASGWRRVLLKDLSVQIGVRNIFGKIPPFDAQQTSNFYLSAYGDIRLRSYWISVKRAF